MNNVNMKNPSYGYSKRENGPRQWGDRVSFDVYAVPAVLGQVIGTQFSNLAPVKQHLRNAGSGSVDVRDTGSLTISGAEEAVGRFRGKTPGQSDPSIFFSSLTASGRKWARCT